MTRARRGESPTKDAILGSARALFAEVGYERASIRAIARAAGVDPALVHHYYGTKNDLLIAAVQLPIDPAPLFAAAFEHPERVGQLLTRSVLTLWDTSDVRERLLALMRAAVTHPGAATILRTVITRDVVGPITERIASPHAELRAELAGTHLAGLALGRYILGIEPLASAPIDQLAAAIGPTVQRYLTDPKVIPG